MPEEPRGAVARPQAAAEPRPDSTARPTELGRRSEMLRGLPYEEQQKALEPAGSATPTLSEEELIAWFDHELGFDTPSNVSNSLDRISRLAPATLRSVWARVQPSTRQSFRDNLEERHLLERPKECQAVLQTIDLAHRVEEAIELIGESDTFSWRLAHAMSRDFTGGDLDRYGQVVEERAAAPDGQSIVAVAGGARPSPGRSADVLGYAGAKVGPADALGAYLAFRGLLGPGEQTHELKDLHAAGSALVPELGQAVKLQDDAEAEAEVDVEIGEDAIGAALDTLPVEDIRVPAGGGALHTGLGWVDGIRARARLADDKAVQLQVHADSASFPEAHYFDASRTPKKRALSFGMTGLELSVAERPVDALHDMDAAVRSTLSDAVPDVLAVAAAGASALGLSPLTMPPSALRLQVELDAVTVCEEHEPGQGDDVVVAMRGVEILAGALPSTALTARQRRLRASLERFSARVEELEAMRKGSDELAQHELQWLTSAIQETSKELAELPDRIREALADETRYQTLYDARERGEDLSAEALAELERLGARLHANVSLHADATVLGGGDTTPVETGAFDLELAATGSALGPLVDPRTRRDRAGGWARGDEPTAPLRAGIAADVQGLRTSVLGAEVDVRHAGLETTEGGLLGVRFGPAQVTGLEVGGVTVDALRTADLLVAAGHQDDVTCARIVGDVKLVGLRVGGEEAVRREVALSGLTVDLSPAPAALMERVPATMLAEATLILGRLGEGVARPLSQTMRSQAGGDPSALGAAVHEALRALTGGELGAEAVTASVDKVVVTGLDLDRLEADSVALRVGSAEESAAVLTAGAARVDGAEIADGVRAKRIEATADPSRPDSPAIAISARLDGPEGDRYQGCKAHVAQVSIRGLHLTQRWVSVLRRQLRQASARSSASSTAAQLEVATLTSRLAALAPLDAEMLRLQDQRARGVLSEEGEARLTVLETVCLCREGDGVESATLRGVNLTDDAETGQVGFGVEEAQLGPATSGEWSMESAEARSLEISVDGAQEGDAVGVAALLRLASGQHDTEARGAARLGELRVVGGERSPLIERLRSRRGDLLAQSAGRGPTGDEQAELEGIDAAIGTYDELLGRVAEAEAACRKARRDITLAGHITIGQLQEEGMIFPEALPPEMTFRGWLRSELRAAERERDELRMRVRSWRTAARLDQVNITDVSVSGPLRALFELTGDRDAGAGTPSEPAVLAATGPLSIDGLHVREEPDGQLATDVGAVALPNLTVATPLGALELGGARVVGVSMRAAAGAAVGDPMVASVDGSLQVDDARLRTPDGVARISGFRMSTLRVSVEATRPDELTAASVAASIARGHLDIEGLGFDELLWNGRPVIVDVAPSLCFSVDLDAGQAGLVLGAGLGYSAASKAVVATVTRPLEVSLATRDLSGWVRLAASGEGSMAEAAPLELVLPELHLELDPPGFTLGDTWLRDVTVTLRLPTADLAARAVLRGQLQIDDLSVDATWGAAGCDLDARAEIELLGGRRAPGEALIEALKPKNAHVEVTGVATDLVGELLTAGAAMMGALPHLRAHAVATADLERRELTRCSAQAAAAAGPLAGATGDVFGGLLGKALINEQGDDLVAYIADELGL